MADDKNTLELEVVDDGVEIHHALDWVHEEVAVARESVRIETEAVAGNVSANQENTRKKPIRIHTAVHEEDGTLGVLPEGLNTVHDGDAGQVSPN